MVFLKSFEIVPGRILRVDVALGSAILSLFNVYAPNDGRERIIFFEKLSDALSHCPQNNIIMLGGDFNCTLNQQLDRNHNEPHPSSANALKKIVDYYNFVDLWRDTFPRLKQYTWMKVNSNNMSGARLDRFYTEACNRGRFFRNSISPTFLSDHHYISMAISVESIKSYKPLWHFDNRLLQDHCFIHSFHFFWNSWREERVNFPSLSQWWDVGKMQIKIFCQQFTAHSRGALLEKMKALEQEILGQSSHSTTGSISTDSFERNKFLLRSLTEEQGKTALLRAKFTRLNDMDSPTAFFFGLEKKPRVHKHLHQLKLPDGRVSTAQMEINAFAVSFYEDLYRAEPCNEAESDVLLSDLPQLSMKDKKDLESLLTMAELSRAVQELNPGKSPGLDGLSAEFYKAFWNLIGQDFYDVLVESIEREMLPLSCRRAVLTLIPKKGDLGCLKNWRPISLLCVDLKIFSKALTNRLKTCIETVIHNDQSYCIPNRTIFDNLFLVRDIITVSKRHNLDIGLFSLDQEKAFDRVDHSYLFKTLEAFGFGHNFVSFIRLMYSDIYSMLRVNGTLTRPFSVTRGIRQGCPLSGCGIRLQC